MKECGTGKTEEKTNFSSFCIPFADYEKDIALCGTGQKIEPEIVVLPCNHSRMQGMISLIPSKTPIKEKSPTITNTDKTKSKGKDKITEDEEEQFSSARTQSTTTEQNISITQTNKANELKKNKSGKLTHELTKKEIEKINDKRHKQMLKIYREFIVGFVKTKQLSDSKEYNLAHGQLINIFAARLQEINDIADTKIGRLHEIARLHEIPKKTACKKTKKLKESLEIFDGSNLPEIYKNALEQIRILLDYFGNRSEALQADGPIARIVFAKPKRENRVQGALYALLRAYLFEQQGYKVIAFENKFSLSESQKKSWGIDKNVIEFDIELEDKFIEVKDISWNFVENFDDVLNKAVELNWLKDLNKVIYFDLNEIDKIFFNDSLIKNTIAEMQQFLLQIKTGNEMAKYLGKKYEFYSKHSIPPIIKQWLKNNKIKFFEKDCTNCDCDKKYSWCLLQ